MTMMQIATELDRLFPDDVDATECDWGHGTLAGYIGHDEIDAEDSTVIVGWYGDGGNMGHPVLYIHADDAEAALAVVVAMDTAKDLTAVGYAMRAAGVRVRGGEGCYIREAA